MSEIEQKLTLLGLTLPPATPAFAVYTPVVVHGNLAFVSGQAPIDESGQMIKGKVGKELTVEQGYHAARCCVRKLNGTCIMTAPPKSTHKQIVTVSGSNAALCVESAFGIS